MSYRLVATDMDGTLLGPDHLPSTRSRAALGLLGPAGATHVVVTGRPVPLIREVLRDLDYEGLAVCGQGGQIFHVGEDRLLSSVLMDRDVARRALDRVEARTGELALSVNRDGLDGEMLAGPGFTLGGTLHMTSVPRGPELWAEPLNKVTIQHPVHDDDTLAALAVEAAGDLVEVIVTGPGMVELTPLGMTKASGLAWAARRMGLTAADTIAFGDMPNDIPMFRWAAHGVAMDNAHPDLKSIADEVTTSNAEDGVAAVLERLYGGSLAGGSLCA
ncbi:HAD family hydrolase [Streptomyces sp. NPDC087917]|uniref:HAD family hydrolase n=1 Tax=Streptomyces sp. NPDC087917 TaxID=3155060 RepID=UPI00343CA4FF